MDRAHAYAIAFYILIFLMIYVSYGMFAGTIVRWCKKPKKVRNKKKELVEVQPPLQTSEAIKCYIPFWQPLEVQKALFKSYGIFGVIQPIAILLTMYGIIVTWFLGLSPKAMFYAHIAFLVGFTLQAIVYGIITAHCAYLYDFNWFVIVGSFICPIIFALWLKNRIPAIMTDKRKGDRFEEVKDDGNTVIKSKSNKRKDTKAVSKSRNP